MTNPFCPLIKEECRDNCAWAGEYVDIDENGIDCNTFCALAIIAGFFYNESER
jgi:hypothetical protein